MAASYSARRVVCLNQGEYIQFQYAVAELHKKIRQAIERRNPDTDDVRTYCNALRTFTDEYITRVAYNNFELLQQYYEGRSDVEPRICIKAVREGRDGSYVIPLFRDHRVAYFSEYPLKAHAAFLLINESGRYCKIDDVPQQALHGAYHNARLDNKKLESYLAGLNSRPKLSSKDERNDPGWLDCWTAHTEAGGQCIRVTDFKWCYKSVLVIPITLWNNALTKDFQEEINKKLDIDVTTPNIGRLIFGYVCLDHVDRSYFCHQEDIDIGYIVADLMSLYMVTRMLYLETSTTFRNASSLFGHNSSE